MSGQPASSEQIDPGEERDVATVRPGECAGEDSGLASIAIYELAVRAEFSQTVNETAMTTEPAFEMDLLASPMCEGDTWTWDGQSLRPPDG